MKEIILGIILGALFGFALYYTGASSPKRLFGMLRLQNLTLMKIIIFAIGLGSVLVSIASLFGIFDLSHLSIKPMNLGVIIGGIIFGLGFGLGGTCPGTCVAATSSGGGWKALSAVIGGLLGAFAFSLSYGNLKRLGLFDVANYQRVTLFQLTAENEALIPIGFGGLFVMGALFMLIGIMIPEKIVTNKVSKFIIASSILVI